jgi:transcriptional regulator with XRE-family HTH domain
LWTLRRPCFEPDVAADYSDREENRDLGWATRKLLILVDEVVRRRHRMNLTQKQLAALAKVSAPTVSRFELNGEDIQLSSALAILTALGMTDRRTLEFPDAESQYDPSKGVTFWGQDGETRVRCRISREALDDHFSEGDRLRPEAAFKKHRQEIEAYVRRKYLRGQKEPDGTVLIRTGDVA